MSEKITFKELVRLIAKQSEQSESSANSFIHELVQIIEGGLKQSGSVSISGFGKFELRWMKERPGVNPQTGDEITIPGQNKVVFKPFKALRETVNKPFENLEPEVLSEEPTSEKPLSEEKEQTTEEKKETSGEFDDDPFGLEGVFATDAPFHADDDDPFDSEPPSGSSAPFEDDEDLDPFDDEYFFEEEEAPFEADEPIQSGKKETVDDLIFEWDNPHFGKKEVVALEVEDDDVLVIAKEEEEELVEKKPAEKPKMAPFIPDESKMAKEVQKSGSFRWSYAAAVIIVMIALILLFWMMQRDTEPSEQLTTATDEPTEQVFQDPSTTDEATEQGTASTEPQSTVDEESPPSTGGSPPQTELETENFTVQNGQSLWDIAESQLGNPYLWPVIYHLNQDILNNPNQLLANANIEIPTFSNPDNLSEFEREQVALGYFSLYQWNRENNPDEARYFLWAVGVFSQDLLDQPPSEVDPQDLAFARNR
ncbi:HU family DNA-binding protein [Rhodohalobacter sp. 614A]|uniref:HU family DNA-binding protein n=1 Tax=Rhodohalobacter sp. 614A TaxID=2908649 RepID=UPI001F1AA373|nr:HU family DNA-binding protein [Rhodohalobacter sp. 614A]